MPRYDYSKIGLSKKDGITIFNGNGIGNFTDDVKEGLANEGYFTKLTRALAGHEKETDVEKKAIVQETYEMLANGKLRTGKKSGQTPEQKAEAVKQASILAIRKAVEHGTKAEKALAESIIAKM